MASRDFTTDSGNVIAWITVSMLVLVGFATDTTADSDSVVLNSPSGRCNCTGDGAVLFSPIVKISNCPPRVDDAFIRNQCPTADDLSRQQWQMSSQILQYLDTTDLTPGPSYQETCASDQQHRQRPRDCAEVLESARETASGRFMLYPADGEDPFPAYCDMETDGGGWTVFQKRTGHFDFYHNWLYYKHGFGSVSSNHWLGNEKIHRLTTQKKYELRVDIEDFLGNSAFAVYDYFFLGGDESQYTLYVGEYDSHSTAGDALSYHRGMRFTTKDNDNDGSSVNCAIFNHGAWWYNRCHHSNLNGRYFDNGALNITGLRWKTWKDNDYSMRVSVMKVRPN